MTEEKLPQEILIVTGPSATSSGGDLAARRGGGSRLPDVNAVDITNLQSQVNVFLNQMNVVMKDTPESVGGFRLSEFEVSAGIVVEGKGGVRIALLGNVELGGQVNAGLKFVFRRT